MSNWSKRWFVQLLLAIVTGLAGVIAYLTPVGSVLEEEYGLSWLFHSRGVISASDNVVIIAIDQISASEFNLPLNPKEWPRDRHADLIDKLIEAGAAVITFDLRFNACGSSPESNEKLARAIKQAGNVVLVERLIDSRDASLFPYQAEKEMINCETGIRDSSESEKVEKGDVIFFRDFPALAGVWRLPILPIIADAALVTAPFILPRGTMRHYWAFNTHAGDIPSLPSAVLQVFALQAYDDFIRILRAVDPILATQFAVSRSHIDMEDLMLTLRSTFVDNKKLVNIMRYALNQDQLVSPSHKKIIHALINLYSGDDIRYLNFYGPPRTVRTLSYHQVLQSEINETMQFDLKDKAVFVGVSASSFSEQDELRDDYITVFKQPDGLQISGVEIAATAFANLLDDRPVRRIPLLGSLSILFLFGFTLSFIFLTLPDQRAAMLVIMFVLIYSYGVYYLFNTVQLWLPIVIPLAQALLSFSTALFAKYTESIRERRILKEAFGRYVPERVVNDFINNAGKETTENQLLYGVCMDTDAEKYTELGGRLNPTELRLLMNDYYATLFKPVKQYEGIVSDVKGDAMLAIWAASTALVFQRKQACYAALEIIRAVECFNQVNHEFQLPTRIGLHAGEMTLGNVGAIHHYEYRAVGDMVNTANRIQGANKYFRTRLLLSKAVVDGLEDFLVRPLGKILLSGKQDSIELVELLVCEEDANDSQFWLCETFAKGLLAYESQDWARACEQFFGILQVFPEDGPSYFFLNICQDYRLNPPQSWDGLTRMPGK